MTEQPSTAVETEMCSVECSVVEASGILIQTNRYHCVLPAHDHDEHDWRRKIER
jgi:hypothetical protein